MRKVAGIKVAGILLAATALALSGCAGHDGSSAGGSSSAPKTATGIRDTASTPTTTTPSRQDCQARYLGQFSTRQKLAQLLTVGIKNGADALQVVQREQVGGLFYGSWTDPSMLQNGQVDQVKAAAHTPLMITVDEEGGRVARLKNQLGPFPSARAAAQSMTSAQYYQKVLARAQQMKKLGMTVDFAPDADVSNEDDDAVIGDRSFANNPAVVTDYAQQAIRALHDAGMGAVIKHFPGHGHGSGDSHTGAVRTPPLSQLQQVDLVPFRNLVGSGAAVMVGHLDVPGLTTPNVPASISPQAMSLLRQGTGYNAQPYDGLIFTDDLSGMAAITARMGIEDAVATALEAGADDALWITTDAVTSVLNRLEQEVNSGRLPMARVDQSVLRVAAFKGVNTGC
ncbi:MAG: glycoside hydrolase family 3 protein [Nocardia sp.]|nr:glycoside hydrolase family 3 protein [Nocardia sp.]